MAASPMTEGRCPYKVPSLETQCETYYKFFGDLKQDGVIPLVILHGGPGSGHEYMLPFQKLWPQYGIPVIFYDEIGCAGSTHLQHKTGDNAFWQMELFVAELENLLAHLGLNDGTTFDLLGHSFGGMLAASFAIKRPLGLRRLILAGAVASIPLWQQGAWKQLREMSPESQRAVEEAVKTNDFTTEAFISARNEWQRTFWSRANPWPAEGLKINLQHQANDPTVRSTMAGNSSIWSWTGSISNWSCIPELHKINVPTLVYKGEFDSSHDDTTVPFFEEIPRVRMITIPGASHMHHVDTPELESTVLMLVARFLQPEGLTKGS